MLDQVPEEAPPADASGVEEVEGCSIAWWAWGAPEAPGVVLVHGARAYAGWWRRVLTPELRAGRRILALDLSGHGDSGQRQQYSPRLWGEEVAAIAAGPAGGRATLVGHSMGGWATLVCAAEHPDLAAAAILVDTSVRRPEPGAEDEPRGMPLRPLRLYGSREEAVAAFRLVPEQPLLDERFVREIAAGSVRREGERWQWKFDPAVAQRYNDRMVGDYLRRVACPLHLVYGGHDPIVSARTAEDIAAIAGRPVPATEVPSAYHHAILDHPEEIAAALIDTGLLP